MAYTRFANRTPIYQQTTVFKPRSITPQLDFKDVGRHYIVIAQLQGFEPRQVKVQVETPNLLVIQGLSEMGSFQRKFELPIDASIDGAEAIWSRGFLTITFPKYSNPHRTPPLIVIHYT